MVLRDAPLASYDGSLNGYPTLPRNESGANQGRVDVNSSAARAYLNLLEQKQNAFLAAAGTQVGRALTADVTLRHAVNAVILDLSDAEAQALRERGDVMLVERERQLELLTDRGPAFIGAPSIWDGSATGGVATKGEGIVAAVLDSGINWQSPAFAGTGPIDGYVHVNPLGAGNYLGLCGPTPPNADLGRCNGKLIGMYNFTSTSPTRSATDDDGHGSHTASTVGGNTWDAPFGGGTFRISGVAPHANIIAYKVCVGSCPSSAITQAANQAVADGIVDVMNFSISGGGSPWTDANSVAFLGAHNAGIFVAASAGNSGPAAGTSDHQEPWVQTVAASTHDRVLGFNLDAAGPGTPPANTQNIPLRPGAPPIQTGDFIATPIVRSPGFADGTTDGCTAFPAGTFTRPYAPPADRVFADGFDPPVANPPPVGAIAVLNLNQNNSGCGSGVRQTNAVAAGAIGVIFVDAFYINLGAAGNAWSMLRSNWDNLALLDPATVTVSITLPARAYPGTGDVVADFSSRGPRALAGNQFLVKPDIAAPGVDILAAYQANVGATPNANETALENGTSMASPHMAGGAVLLRALHPTWTPMQIKSALMLTSKTAGLVKQSGQPSDAWDRGAGRVDLAAAAKAGLVLDETGANFLAANPATGGNVANLNLPSLATASCVGTCTFTRTVRRALTGAQTYTVSTAGFPGSAVAVTPASFTIGSSGTRALTITVQSQLLPEAAWALGEIVLTPASPAEPPMHMPVAIRPGGPVIATTPTALNATSDLTSVQTLTIKNLGNPTLNWTIGTSGTAQVTPLNTVTTGNGQQGGFYNGSSRGYYWAQNFDVTAQTHVTTLRANGFTLPNTTLTTSNTPSVTFSIYADASGVPAGAPQGFGAAPLWTYSNTIGTPNGITTTSGNLQLNLTAANVAGTPLDLAPGRYWLMVWPTINGQGNATAGNPLWAWRVSSDPQIGAQPQLYAPWDDPLNWQFDVDTKTMSAFVQGTVDCTQPAWIGYSNTGGALGFAGQTTTDATFNAAGLAAGTYRATLCLNSNATNAATLPVPLTFVVPNGGLMPPTLSKAFAPTSVDTGVSSTLTLTLGNGSGTAATLTSALVDNLPSGLVVAATPNASTTCASGSVTATAGAGSVTLGSGAQIPANGSCTVVVSVSAASGGSYPNTIPAGGLVTDRGSNVAAANATLTVTVPVIPPTVTKAFAPTGVNTGVNSTLTITLANTNATAATLTAGLVDTLPGGLVVAPTPNASTTCTGGSVTAAAGAGSVTLSSGAQIPANGSCTITADVRSGFAGSYANTIAAGALQTSAGTNAAAANATLTVTAPTFGSFPPTENFDVGVTPPALPASWTTDVTGSGTAWLTQTTSVDTAPNAAFTASKATTGSASLVSPAVAVNAGARLTFRHRLTTEANFDGGVLEISVDGGAFQDIVAAGGTFAAGGYGTTLSNDASCVATPNPLAGRASWNGTIAAYTTVTAVLPASTGGHNVAFRWRHGSDCSSTPANSGWWVDSIALDTGSGISVTKAFAPTNTPTGSPSKLTVTLSNTNTSPATLSAALTDTFPANLVVAATPNGSTTCAGGNVTAIAGGGSASLDPGATIPAFGTCTFSVDVSSATPAIYVNTIAAGALQTSNGNNAAATTANYQAVTPGVPTYSTGFESPFTAAALNGQQGWGASGAQWVVSTLNPGAGTQHMRATSNASAPASPQLALSPTQAQGTTTYSIASARIAIGNNATGSTWDFSPQDTGAGLVNTRVQFVRGTRVINVLEGSTSTFVNTGAQWPAATYFDIKVEIERATKALKVCLNGTTIYTGTAFAGSVRNIALRGSFETGSSTSTYDVDNVTIENSNTDGGCAPAVPTVNQSYSPPGVEANIPSTLTIALTNINATPATLSASVGQTFPSGLVIAPTPNASTTCTGGSVTAAAGTDTVTLSSGAQIPPGGCTVKVDVVSATAVDYTTTIPAGALQTNFGNNAAASVAKLYVGNIIVNSGPINVLVPANSTGVYFDFVAGTNNTTGAGNSTFNPYGSTNLTFFWANAATLTPVGVSATAGGPYSVLASGATVGPASVFSNATTAAAAANWRVAAGVNGYLGIRFLNTTVTPNVTTYGYVHMTTSGTTGHPATVVEYAYNRAGGAITIP
ncbi:S8 family serine peptidase [Tahibacter soli]|uniref:S8 family serine peptidase n=1 Tax=Tahibacter soli TaxID=2983605 RepID=A0A9X3YRL0_9GAMM|nr:S8 family serine peptidase [Tahibacter soli]MDC8015046.1 S8 family serine peptidase [Tahibacter soli]